jgi:long-chain acyl-CoA synthetase
MADQIVAAVPTLKTIIYYGDTSENDLNKLQDKIKNTKILSLEQVRTLGAEHPVDPTPPVSSDICCIMYTSGSTGNPKGVVILHSNLIACAAGGVDVVTGHIEGGKDSYLAFLPLAHILELLSILTICHTHT